jgi:hypothetical protein
MANNLLTISKITNEALMVLENELTFTSEVNRDYDDQFAVIGAKIGNTINVRRPGRFIGTSGPALNVEDFNETSIPVVLGQLANYGDQFHVDTQFTTQDLALSLDLFSDRVLKSCVAAIANRIDFIGLQMAKNSVANIVGTPGVTPTGLLTYLQAAALLDSEAAPRDGRRSMMVEQFTSATIVDSLKGLFVPQTAVGEQYKKGLMGRDSGGMNWYMDQNVPVQSFGYWNTVAGALTISTASQGLASGWASSSNLTLTASQACTLAQGDTFSIAGVAPVNPQNRRAYGVNRTRTFVVNTTFPATTVALAAGTPTVVNVSPALIYGGQFQNCTASPAAGAAVTPTSIATGAANAQQSPQNILMHRNAFVFATCDLELPEGVHFAGRASDKEIGLSIRVVRQYTINNDSVPTRLDVLFGWAPLYQELACRVAA